MQRINLIGCGRVGQTLGRLWHTQPALQTGIQVQDVLTTSLASATAAVQWIGAGRAVSQWADLRPAELWLIATPDTQIAQASQMLAQHQTALSDTYAVSAHGAPGIPSPLVFHASGACGADLLTPLQTLGWRTASAHCLLSFATPQMAVQQFAGTTCALEGAPQACSQLQTVFEAIGARCFVLASEHKLLYHAAAVFATNFLPVLQSVAEDLWRSTGVPEQHLPHLRTQLLGHAVANISALGPHVALTGPAARGDLALLQRQGAAVTQWNADAGAAYAALSTLALQVARRARKF
jgi:predicted short-subunit dehydrogenase-like oxidoreductase (DUF2520 family)